MKNIFLLMAVPALFWGCLPRPAARSSAPQGIVLAAGLPSEPVFDLAHDPASGRSFFLWSPVARSTAAAVTLACAAPDGSIPWRTGLKPGGTRQFEGRVAVSSGAVYAFWLEPAGGGYALNAASFDVSGKPLLPVTVVSGISRLIVNSLSVAAGRGRVVYAAWQDFNDAINAPFVRIAAIGPEGVLWLRTLGGEKPDESYLNPVIADAGPNGVLAAFRHLHDGDKGIVVRRFLPDGSSWADEAPVSEVMGYKSAPQIVHDGAGGAYVIWEDGRRGDLDVYAQHMGADGSVLWDPDGVAIAASAGNQWNTRIAADGTGGFFCAWIDDNQGSKWALMAQHVDNSGDTLWSPEGLTVCPTGNDQSLPSMAPDGYGGALLVWNEDRDGYSGTYAQRLNWRGGAFWPDAGATVASSDRDTVGPQAEPDGKGGLVAAWKEKVAARRWQLRARRLDGQGAPLWR